ncbi:nitroreductase/quinone reductase family protein [Nocardia sp. CDC153]|uniref:nitroreductase/quinone reductase family protein n=1 Tax=Nocardia sp. CDC153 TaxID=3112167 RepID=UPI002DBBCEC3|nr:nitroreductase/quinone reductase family protein [Nocardia sp. CDC153]MEC3956127.1 nitroreductase/quinone reductase family protein [Nocardia sp. CDC153]
MTEQTPETNPYGTPTTSGPEPLRSYQKQLNTVMRTLLKVPFLGPQVGKRLCVLHVVGRKSGKVYDIPVAYTRHDGDILIGTGKWAWVNNIRKGTPLAVSFGGPKRTADAEVLTDAESVVRLSEVIARDNKQWAKFNGVGLDAQGNPNKADAYQSWQKGTVIIRLTVH